MNKNYYRDHKIVCSEAIPGLNISEKPQVVVRVFCATPKREKGSSH